MEPEKPTANPPAPKLTRLGYRYALVPGCPYTAIYGTGDRAMKRWREIGLAANPPEPPPLDDPVAMVEWWERCMSQRPSSRVLAARERYLAGEFAQWLGPLTNNDPVENGDKPAPGKNLQTSTEKTKPGRIALSSDELAAIQPLELDAHLEELKRTTAILRAEYEKTARDRDRYSDTDYQRAHKRYLDSISALTDLEEKLAAHRQTTGALIPVDQLRAELPVLLAPVSDGFVSLLIELGQPRARALALVDPLFRALRESRFAPATTSQPAAA